MKTKTHTKILFSLYAHAHIFKLYISRVDQHIFLQIVNFVHSGKNKHLPVENWILYVKSIIFTSNIKSIESYTQAIVMTINVFELKRNNNCKKGMSMNVCTCRYDKLFINRTKFSSIDTIVKWIFISTLIHKYILIQICFFLLTYYT